MVVARNGNSDYDININLGSQKITKQNVTKVLGILIQDDLKWDTQISHLSKKINAANHALYSIRKSISLEALIFVYYAYDYSFLIFGIMFWGGQNNHLMQKFILQKRSVRLNCGIRARDSCRGQFKKLNFLTVPCIFIYTLCTFKFNNSALFETNYDLHDYNTRNKEKVAIPCHSSSRLSRSPYYIAGTFFDHLPSLLRMVKNVNLFKNLLRKILVDKEYYDVKSFSADKLTDNDLLKFITRSDLINFF